MYILHVSALRHIEENIGYRVSIPTYVYHVKQGYDENFVRNFLRSASACQLSVLLISSASRLAKVPFAQAGYVVMYADTQREIAQTPEGARAASGAQSAYVRSRAEYTQNNADSHRHILFIEQKVSWNRGERREGNKLSPPAAGAPDFVMRQAAIRIHS